MRAKYPLPHGFSGGTSRKKKNAVRRYHEVFSPPPLAQSHNECPLDPVDQSSPISQRRGPWTTQHTWPPVGCHVETF